MPILRPYLIPTLGTPQPVVAPSRARRTMNQGAFYSDQMQGGQPPQQQIQQQQPFKNAESIQVQPQEQQFEPTSNTGDYLVRQLQNYQNRPAPPMLEPGQRVRSANAELVQPSNFKVFYEQLAAIDQQGQEQLGAATARSAFKRLQDLQSIRNQQIPMFNGMPVGYKNPNNPYTGGGSVGAAGSGLMGRIGSGLGLGGSSSANFNIAKNLARQFGWNANEVQAWYTLGMKESGWRNTAQNPTSTAYGIGQFLNSTWAGVGIPKTSDPQKQVLAMARYIKNRYGSPSRALAFHLSHNWY